MSINTTLYLSGFITGFIVAIPTVIVSLHFLFNRKSKKQKEHLTYKSDNTKGDDHRYGQLVQKRLERVKEISDRQGVLFIQASMPSKNSLHSKQQNEIVNEIKTLEKEKYELLTAILNDGYDPVLTMQDPHSGDVRQEKLSAFMGDLPPEVIEENTTPGTKVTQKGKFKVYENIENRIEDFDSDDDEGDGHTFH